MKPETDKSTPQPTRPLFDNLSQVEARLRNASHLFLFLDFDGTLAPIVNDPADAFMPAKTALSLVRLAQKPNISIAVISGRSLEDLEERVSVPGITYAGDHGFAIRGQGLNFVERIAAERRRALKSLCDRLQVALQGIPGVLLEEKGFTATVHYRLVPGEFHERVLHIVKEAVDNAEGLFRLTHGLFALELRPHVDWNKGNAARWIMGLSGYPDSLPIYIGDDTTDEDAFTALDSGITIRVGPGVQTNARYSLEHQGRVAEFLAWLVHLDLKGPGDT
jgi:trehalose-phosphatase